MKLAQSEYQRDGMILRPKEVRFGKPYVFLLSPLLLVCAFLAFEYSGFFKADNSDFLLGVILFLLSLVVNACFLVFCIYKRSCYFDRCVKDFTILRVVGAFISVFLLVFQSLCLISFC